MMATIPGPREKETCSDYVLPALAAAGWTNDQIVEQFRIAPGRIVKAGKRHRRHADLRADYVLQYRPGVPVAVVEAKREYNRPGLGMQQAENYAGLIDVPFAYSTNGKGIVERDLSEGTLHDVPGFPSPAELWGRYRAFKGILDDTAAADLLRPFNRAVRLGDGSVKEPRYYQQVAINRAVKAILRGDKRLLITMATGSGKTFVAMQIVWKLWKSAWDGKASHRFLYLADRKILVNDPMKREFQPAFGDGPIWKIEGEHKTGRDVYFALYQSIADAGEDPNGIFREYDSDYFDLVIVDECHRGSAKDESAWREILDHFSGATQLGMTATPRCDETVDTYDYFGDSIYEYSLAQGIDDGYLAPYRVRRVVLSSDAYGYSPEEGTLDLYGKEIPPKLYDTNDFERVVALLDRTETAAKHLTEYLKRTDRLAKTVVFCVNQDHAERMRNALLNENTDLVKTHLDYVVQITSDQGTVGQAHLDSFADTEKDYPVIAITSHLLSTGVDLPTVKNVVIFKPIGSMTMFKQIIGRGTRVYEDADKFSFDIIDYSGATVLFADPEFDGPPERVDRETIDEQGEVVEELVVAEPEPPYGDTASHGELDEADIESRADRVFYVGDEEKVWVVGEALYELDPVTRKPKLMEYWDFVADTVRSLFQGTHAASQLCAKWADPVARKELTDELASRGIDASDLEERTGLGGTDTLDILVHVAWNHPLVTRHERVRRARRNHAQFFEQFRPEARQVLDELLAKYARHGVDELNDLAVLEVPPLDGLGSPTEIARRFGGAEALEDALVELQKCLYVA